MVSILNLPYKNCGRPFCLRYLQTSTKKVIIFKPLSKKEKNYYYTLKITVYLHSGKLPCYQKPKYFDNWIYHIKFCMKTKLVSVIYIHPPINNCISNCVKPHCFSHSYAFIKCVKTHSFSHSHALSHTHAHTYKHKFPNNFPRTERLLF